MSEFLTEEEDDFLKTFPTPLDYKLAKSIDHYWVLSSQGQRHHEIQQQQGFQTNTNNNNYESFSEAPHDGSDVLNGENSTRSEKISQENILLRALEASERGKKPIAPLARKYKTAPILLSKDAVEHQYRNTRKEAAKTLNGARLVEEVTVIDIPNSKTSETEFVEISSSISSYMNYLEHSMEEIQTFGNFMAPLERACTANLTLLPQEVTKRQFGNNIQEATQKRNGDKSNVLDVENFTWSEKTLQENILLHVPEVLERRMKPMVDNYITPSERKYKTPPILLPEEVDEHQYGNTMKEAAKTINGAGLVDEVTVIDFQNKMSEIELVDISSPLSPYMNYLKHPVEEIQMVHNFVAASERTCTANLTLLPQEVTKRRFGNTIEEAAQKRNGLGDESDILYVEKSGWCQKMLHENTLFHVPEALERGKKPMVDKYIAPSERKYKTPPILLSEEAIEHQYVNRMKEATKTLNERGDESDVSDVFDYVKRSENTIQENILLRLPEALEKGKKLMVENCIAPWAMKYNTAPILSSQEFIQCQYRNTMKEAGKTLNGDQSDVPDVENFARSEKIIQENIVLPEALERGKKPMVDNYIAPSARKYKTAPIILSEEAIEHQYGNTVKEDAKTLNEPRDESHVPDVETSARSEKVLHENVILPIPESLEPTVEKYIAPSKTKYKTAPIPLSKEAIERQYGNTIKEAAKNLNVSVSTLKRKYKAYGISEWQGPSSAKRKVNDSGNQSNKSEEYDGAVQHPSAINKNENTLTIKAEYADDMIKFHLCISKATFITIEEEIGKKFKLTHGTYKLKYLDEDKDWILLASDQDVSDCIKSSRNLGRIVLRMRVLPSSHLP